MRTERGQTVCTDVHVPGVPASYPRPSTRDTAIRTGKSGLPPCLFYDSVTQFFCMLRKRRHRDQGVFSCAACPRS